MGWPEEPTSWGVPGHVDQGLETELIRDQIRRLSAPVAGTRYLAGTNLAAGIAGTESSTNMSTGVGFFEAGRRYKVRVRWNMTTSDTTSTYLFRFRVGDTSGTQINEWTYTAQGASFGWRYFYESDWVPSADTLDTIVWTCQRVGGTGTLTVIAGATTAPTFIDVWHAGHDDDVTTVS